MRAKLCVLAITAVLAFSVWLDFEIGRAIWRVLGW